jgi:hypothetical protein
MKQLPQLYLNCQRNLFLVSRKYRTPHPRAPYAQQRQSDCVLQHQPPPLAQTGSSRPVRAKQHFVMCTVDDHKTITTLHSKLDG